MGEGIPPFVTFEDAILASLAGGVLISVAAIGLGHPGAGWIGLASTACGLALLLARKGMMRSRKQDAPSPEAEEAALEAAHNWDIRLERWLDKQPRYARRKISGFFCVILFCLLCGTPFLLLKLLSDIFGWSIL